MDERAFIGVGSNIGDGIHLCVAGIKKTLLDERVEFIAVSSFYTTSPVSPIPQDYFTNCAIAVKWSGSPAELLELLNRIELDMGRTRPIASGPRVIDLDILLFGDKVLSTPSLVIPHPELHRRRFALAPCVEIDPSIVHPVYQRLLDSFLVDIDPSQEISVSLPAVDVRRLIRPDPYEGGAD